MASLYCNLSFLHVRRELFKKLNNFVHLNLCIALACGLLIFLAGIEGAKGVPVSLAQTYIQGSVLTRVCACVASRLLHFCDTPSRLPVR